MLVSFVVYCCIVIYSVFCLMLRLPPRSTRTDTLFPYTTLFRSPWVGPSSILLSLMASGLDGQRFAFHGYAPVDPAERAKQLRAWESASHKQEQTQLRSEEHTSELQSLMRTSYAVFCLKKNNNESHITPNTQTRSHTKTQN